MVNLCVKLHHKILGEWTWLDGQPWDFVRWGEKEPNGGADENCLELVKWAEWVRIISRIM